MKWQWEILPWMVARNERSSRMTSWRKAGFEPGFLIFFFQKPDRVPTFSKNGLSVKRTVRCKAMNSKNKERLRPTGMKQRCLVSSQAPSGFFVWSKSLILMVGASGFEPPTSWSRRRRRHKSKCRFWCRLRDFSAVYPALELDRSWTEPKTAVSPPLRVGLSKPMISLAVYV